MLWYALLPPKPRKLYRIALFGLRRVPLSRNPRSCRGILRTQPAAGTESTRPPQGHDSSFHMARAHVHWAPFQRMQRKMEVILKNIRMKANGSKCLRSYMNRVDEWSDGRQ